MRLEDLHFAARDDGAANAANELLTFPTEHHAANYLDPTTAPVEVEIRDHS